MDDLIRRNAAINALWEIRQKEISDGRRFHDYCSLSTAVDVIKDLLPAHPEIEERKEESAQNVPKEDLISRKAAIDAAIKADMENNSNVLSEKRARVIDRHISAVPSAQPEPQWIPCSERLPEEDKDVLVTVYFAGLTQKHKTGWNDHIKPSTYVDIASYFDGDWSSASDEYKVARNRHRVIAWMPLPEPYRVERRTDDANDIT